MKLEYKILWLDDKIDVITEERYDKEIYSFIKDQGFNPVIVTVQNETDFFNKLDDTFDLILTDYHLNDEGNEARNGDSIINEVRNTKNVFTEIMFYSAQGDATGKVNLDRITFVDTKRMVGNNHYEKLVSKALKLIELTIKKFQHIVSMRGMIMNETSSLDVEMMDLLVKIIDKKGEENVIPIIKAKYKETNITFNSEIETISDVPIILQKIGSEHRWRAIVRTIEKDELKKIFDKYKEEIIDERNRFAHAILEKDETGREYFKNKKDGIDFNDKKCREIRQNIIKHKENLNNLKEKLQ